MVNIIVVFPKLEDAKNIRNLLARNGYSVTGVCCTGAQVLQITDNLEDGIVICGYRFNDMMYADLRDSLAASFQMLLVASMHILGYRISAAAAAYRRSCQYAGDDGGRNVSTQEETEVTAEGTFRSREKSDPGCEKAADGAKPYVRRRGTSLYAKM